MLIMLKLYRVFDLLGKEKGFLFLLVSLLRKRIEEDETRNTTGRQIE